MEKNVIDLKSVNELLGCKFYIPSYQRGYRWTEQQMNELLNDLWTFKQRVSRGEVANGKEFYCLQPIVVKNRKKDTELLRDGEWEVIDGQQRLTSILILLSCVPEILKILKKEPFGIKFETRHDSESFLKQIDISQIDANIDYNHICRAYKVVEKWLEGKDGSEVVSFISDVLTKPTDEENRGNNVRFIWYEIKDETINTKEVFQRLNIGKIPLTNSELIKALFLSNNNKEDNKIFQLRQNEIAQEWDRMEYAFQDDRFWLFLNEQTEEKKGTRIDFIFDLLVNKTDEQKKNDKYRNFSFLKFQDLYLKNKDSNDYWNSLNIFDLHDAWKKVRQDFQILQDWYHNEELYHYVGFLICCGTKVSAILDIYKRSHGATSFKTNLREEIKRKLPQIQLREMNYRIRGVREVLLLFNIESILNQYNELKIEYKNDLNTMHANRFPFGLYKVEKWDIEHVHSQTENDLTSKEDQKKWLQYALLESVIKEELGGEIEKNIQNIDSLKFDSFQNIQNKIIKLVGEDSENEEKDNIANLTLLDARTNRAYKNALFPTKRNIIISKDKAGTFIPICTKNLFLKYYTTTPQKSDRWTADDMSEYFDAIQKTLEYYYPYPIKENEYNGEQ